MLAALCSVVMAASLYTEADFNAIALQARARFIMMRPDDALRRRAVPLASWCALAAPPPSRPARTAARCASLRRA